MQYRLSQKLLYLQTTSIFRESVIKIHLIFTIFFYLGQQPLQWAMASSFTTFLDHTQRRTTVGRVISPSQRPLPDNIQHSQQTDHPWPRWDSSPQSQQAIGRRQTARPLGPARIYCSCNKCYKWLPPTNPPTYLYRCMYMPDLDCSGVPRGGSNSSRNSEGLPKSCQTQPNCENR